MGGTFRVVVRGLVPGRGRLCRAHERLTSTIGGALFSIPAIKGVEFGMGFEAARRPGSQVHDPIVLDREREFTRTSNNAGGLEGGMTTGMPLVVTAAMKPIPTLMRPLQTVNLDTLEVAQASKERSDVCAVPAAAVVAEGEVAFACDAYMRKFGILKRHQSLQATFGHHVSLKQAGSPWNKKRNLIAPETNPIAYTLSVATPDEVSPL